MLGIQIPTVYDLKMFNSIKNHKSLAKVDTAIRQDISHIFNKEFYKQNTDFLAFTLVEATLRPGPNLRPYLPRTSSPSFTTPRQPTIYANP